MQDMTGINCFVLGDGGGPIDVVHPSWLKCKIIDQIPSHNEFLVFDADIVCRRTWDPEAIFNQMGRAFCAVPDFRSQEVFDECNSIGVAFPDVYLNGGLLMFGREHKPIWDCVLDRHPGPFGKWLEQGALNIALLDSGCDVCRLPRIYNTLVHKGNTEGHVFDISRAINVHFCGVSHPDSLSILQAQIKVHENNQHAKESVGVAGGAAQECSLR